MSMDVSDKRRIAEASIYASIAKSHQEAMAVVANKPDQERREAVAAHLAATNATTRTEKATAQDVAAGRDVLERAYGKKADDVAAILSGRTAGYDLPKGFERTKDMESLVQRGKNMASDATMEAYMNRGRVEAIGPSGHYLEKAGKEADQKERLVNHMLNVRAAVDAHAEKQGAGKEIAAGIYQRIEKETFTREDSASVKKDFADFEKAHAAKLQREVAAEVQTRYAEHQRIIESARQKEAEKAAREGKANDFRNLKPEDAIKKHPDLANAYGVVRAAELVAEKKFVQQDDRQKFVGTMKENVAQRIEQGKDIPQVKLREQQQEREAEPAMER